MHNFKPFPHPPSGPVVVDGDLLRRLFEVVSWQSRLQVQPPLRIGDGGSGPIISLQNLASAAAIPAIIVGTGPSGELDSDIAHNQYFVQKQKLGAAATVTIDGNNYKVPTWTTDGDPVLAVNRAERSSQSHLLSVGIDVELYAETGGVYWFDRVKAVLFPVLLTQDGGSSGDSTTQCSFTYTPTKLNTQPIYIPGGTTQITGLSPTWNRAAIGKMIAGTHGQLFYNGSTWVLWDCDEQPDLIECT